MGDEPGWDLSQAFAEEATVRREAAELPGRCRALADRAPGLLAAGDAAAFAEQLGTLRADVDHVRDVGRMLQYADAGAAVGLVGVLLGAAVDAQAELDRALDAWCAVPDERAEALLAEAALEPARHVLRHARLLHRSRLPAAEERVWSARHTSARTRWESLHEQLEGGVRVAFDDGTGEREVGLAQLSAAARHPDRALRRRAYAGLVEGYRGIAELVASCWDSVVADRLAEDRLRGRAHPALETLEEEELTLAGFEALLAATEERVAVRRALHPPQARLLGVERLEPADLDAEPSDLPEIGWQRAWQTATGALGGLAPSLGARAQQLLTAGRVDLQQRPGKQAYAVTFLVRRDPPAFVSASFAGRVSNVITIGHELGHAVALGAMWSAQPPISRGWPGVAFEVPSYLGEISTGDALVASAGDGQRDAIGLVAVQDLVWAIFEATAFCRAELELYALRAAGEPLTADVILDVLHRHLAALLGPEVALGADDALVVMAGWAGYGVSYRFYNFQYAVGALTALAILARGREDPARLGRDVEAFLAHGRRLSPAAQLAPFGLELGSRALWDEGLDELERRIAALER